MAIGRIARILNTDIRPVAVKTRIFKQIASHVDIFRLNIAKRAVLNSVIKISMIYVIALSVIASALGL